MDTTLMLYYSKIQCNGYVAENIVRPAWVSCVEIVDTTKTANEEFSLWEILHYKNGNGWWKWDDDGERRYALLSTEDVGNLAAVEEGYEVPNLPEGLRFRD